MSSLRYDMDERGHMRPDAKGEWVPYPEWEKSQVRRREQDDQIIALTRREAELTLELAVLRIEGKNHDPR